MLFSNTAKFIRLLKNEVAILFKKQTANLFIKL